MGGFGGPGAIVGGGAPLSQLELASGESGTIVPGMPVYLSAAATGKKAKADSITTGRVFGLSLGTVLTSTSGIFQAGDTITLTTGQWDAIAGTTGGLAFDVPYYLSADTAGELTSTPPSAAGQIVQQVIVGISPTQAKIDIADPVVIGSGTNIIPLHNDNAGALIIGTPVYTSSPGGVDQGIANNTGKSVIQGLVSDVSIGAGQIGLVAVGGLIVATTAQWDAVCGTSGGLTPDAAYYLHPTVAGRMTPTAPTTTGQEVAQIITALSATEARIAITSPVLL